MKKQKPKKTIAELIILCLPGEVQKAIEFFTENNCEVEIKMDNTISVFWHHPFIIIHRNDHIELNLLVWLDNYSRLSPVLFTIKARQVAVIQA